MSELGDLELGVVALIDAIEQNGDPVFASVSSWPASDRRSAIERARSQALAGALISVGQRERAPSGLGGAADERVTVLLSAQSLRHSSGARIGDIDSVGAFTLADLVTQSLEGVVVSGLWRLGMADQQAVFADERTVVIEQRWVAQRLSVASAPMFDGVVITGVDSVVHMEVGERVMRRVEFAFAGVDGVFHLGLGAGERTIVWRGVLRADDHAAMNGLEATLELLVASGSAGVITDSVGQSFPDCAMASFEREGLRRVHAATSRILQPFVMRFVQLDGAGA